MEVETIMEAIKKTIAKTNNKKTTSMVILYLLFEVVKILKPDLFSDNVEHIIVLTINSGLVGGILHKIWRRYAPKLYEYIKTKLNSLKKALN